MKNRSIKLESEMQLICVNPQLINTAIAYVIHFLNTTLNTVPLVTKIYVSQFSTLILTKSLMYGFLMTL